MITGYNTQTSRRDITLLTVDFNLRAENATLSSKVLQGRHICVMKVSPLRGYEGVGHFVADTIFVLSRNNSIIIKNQLK